MIERLVVWGGLEGLESHRWIHKAFHEAAHRMGLPTVWAKDAPESVSAIQPGDTVLAADVFSKHLPYVSEVDYCLHNFDGNSLLCRALAETPERLLRLQVWTTDAVGEKWTPFRQFDRAARTLFQPWGCDLGPDEFLEPVFNPDATEVGFVGSVWSDQYQGAELGNEAVIAELRQACAARGLTFVHRTHISSEEMVRMLRRSRLAPAFAGGWQVAHGYLPCRAFKAPAYGVLGFSNVLQMESLFGAASIAQGSVGAELRVDRIDVAETLDAALLLGRTRYLNLVREQQRVVANYTYRQSLLAISRAFDEIRA